MQDSTLVRLLEQLDVTLYDKIQTLLEIRAALIDGESLTVATVADGWSLNVRTAQRYLRDLCQLEEQVQAEPEGTGFRYHWEPDAG
jgi:predicted DNA-binding transcriptional regulator YafY